MSIVYEQFDSIKNMNEEAYSSSTYSSTSSSRGSYSVDNFRYFHCRSVRFLRYTDMYPMRQIVGRSASITEGI